MTKASDNAFPSVLITEGTEPSAPAAGKQRVYIDSTSHHLKRTDSSGADVDLETNQGAGGMATDSLWDAAGDLAQGTGANTGGKLSAGTAGMFLKSAGAAAANLWAYPPGYELDYVEKTSGTSITATVEASSDTIVTGNSVAYDGSTVVLIEFYSPSVRPDSGAAGRRIDICLFDGSTSLGFIGTYIAAAANAANKATTVSRRLTPSAASHTYSIRAFVNVATGSVSGGAGGAGAPMPAYIRITKV